MKYNIWMKYILIFACSFSYLLHAEECVESVEENELCTPCNPWFTGPFVSPRAVVTPLSTAYLRGSVSDLWSTRAFNGHWHEESDHLRRSWAFKFRIAVGVYDRFDIQFEPEWIHNKFRGHSSFLFGDMPIGFNYQIIADNDCSWFDAVKLGVFEIIPSGFFQYLNPNKYGTDGVGAGAYRSRADLVFLKDFCLWNKHCLRTQLSFIYTYSQTVKVEGANSYGGADDTFGKVYPGQTFESILALEYSISPKYAFSCECIYSHFNRTFFRGDLGFSSPGVPAVMGNGSRERISFTTCLEYSMSEQVGFMAGAWFATHGRNATKFNGAIFSVVYRDEK